MVNAVYAIDDFPGDALLWRIEWIGGVGYNTTVIQILITASKRFFHPAARQAKRLKSAPLSYAEVFRSVLSASPQAMT